MHKMLEVERIIIQSKDVDEMIERLFWMDCYIVDDGQWILDTNQDKIYGQASPYYRSIIDLMGDKKFKLYHETDQDLIDELDKF